MQWGVGTGRCGTKSLAADLGGQHEPKPWFGAESVAAHYGDAAADRVCRERLAERAQLDTPAIVDLHQSWLIPLISQVDPEASFVWVMRDPAGCVASLLAGGAWSQTNPADGLWHPWRGWPEGFSPFDRALGYWAEVNLTIASALAVCGRPWELRRTVDLVAHENRYPASAQWVFSEMEQKRLAIWNEVLYERQAGPANEGARMKAQG